MGRLEQESKRRTRSAHIRAAILSSVKLAGLLAVALAVPNAISGLHKLGIIPSSRSGETLKRSYSRLVAKGFLMFDGRHYRLTKRGDQELRFFEERNFKIRKPRRWDKKWRVLVFDIPERQRSLRNKIRHTLQQIGFVRLQDSVWIFPYDCEDLVMLLKADFCVGYRMLYMVVDQLEGERRLKQEFGLR